MALLDLYGVTLGFGGHPLLDEVDLHLASGERIGLLGRNGVGKSTLMRVIHGEQEIESGRLEFSGNHVGYLIQEVPHDVKGSAFRVVASGLGEAGEWVGEFNEISDKIAEDPKLQARFDKLQEKITNGDHWILQSKIDKVLAHAKIDPNAEVSTMSSGQKRRVLLARSLVQEPDLLLLDEPTNHMDIDAITALEEFLQRFQGTLLFTTHDRAFLRKLSTRILDLDRGHLRSYDCGYDLYLERKQAFLDSESEQHHQFDKKLAQEEVWIRRGIKARRVRNQGRVRRLEDLRRQREARRERVGKVKMVIQDAQKSGRLVARAKNLSFSYDDRTIVKDFSTMIMRGDRIGIIGPNGAGKTTLVKLLLGELQAQSGTIDLGTNLEIVYFDQLREQLDEDKTVADNIAGGSEYVDIGGQRKHVLGYLQDFLFSPERARRPIRSLSGGERNRLLLARLFTKPANVLVLDEPTNDLDVETLDLLEARVLEFPGTILLVSHDRDFLDNVVTSTIVFEKTGVKEYVGGYSDWLAQRPAEPVKVKKKPVYKNAKKTKKLSYHLKKELAGLPDKIEKLETLQASIHEQMAQPEFYNDPAKVKSKSTELEEVEAKLGKAYERWEELESYEE